MRHIATAFVLLLSCAAHANAQSCAQSASLQLYDLTGPQAVLARALSATMHVGDKSSGIFRNSVRRAAVCLDSLAFLRSWVTPPAHKLVQAVPVQTRMIGNSAYPRSINDGLLWSGKGLNGTVAAGVRAEWRGAEAIAAPVAAYMQNADHTYVRSTGEGYSPFANPDHLFQIDYPKRQGVESISRVDWGQSTLSYSAGPGTIAFSNENLWLGGGQVYSILLSNTGPSFPHLRVGTRRPVNIWAFNAELNVFWGSVQESIFFDGLPDNDSHLFTGTSITLEPRFMRGLHLGVARIYHDTNKALGHGPGFYLQRIFESPLFEAGNRPGNAIGALYFRWVLPESGFEAYGEWTREDTPFNVEDILREPDWTQAFGAGLQKVIYSPQRLTRVYAELIHLGASTATVRTARGPFTTYTHSAVPQGHSHRGQMLGSGTGPGSDAQRVGADVFTGNAQTGLYIERIRYDDDAYYATFGRQFGEARHDIEITLALQRTQRLGSLQLHGGVTLSRRYDRDFISLRSESPVMKEMNLGSEIRLQWQPSFR